jgi:hypothetical protein
MSDSWYVLIEGQQLGPYTGEQLVQFAQEGRIMGDTLVWAEGMAEWLPATQISGLMPAAPVAVEAAAPAPAAAPAAWAPPGARRASVQQTSARPASALGLATAAPVGGPYPYFPIKAASFGMWVGAFAGAVLCSILLIAKSISMANAAVSAGMQAQSPEAADQAVQQAAASGVGMLLVLAALTGISGILSAIFFYINIYRAWSCLRAGAPTTTPGKAVGLLFIPLFNLYWMFIAISGLAKDWNRVMSSYEDLQTAPRFNEMMFLLFCIGSIIFPPLALFTVFPVLSQICKGINFFAFRRDPNKPGAFGSPALGGGGALRLR